MARPTLHDLPAPPPDRTGWPWTEQSDPLPNTQPDGSRWPKISIVTPSYNQGQFIEETIRSVLLQRYPNLEYVVIDGGSTDESVEIIQKYDRWIDYWVSEEDDGQSDAINKGFERTSGDLIAWINSSDFYTDRALVSMMCAFGTCQKDAGAIVGTGKKINDRGDIIYTPPDSGLTYTDFLNWLSGGSFMQPACFFTREAWENCGPLEVNLRYAMDIDLFFKIVQSYRFHRIYKTISYAHWHKDAKTAGERKLWRMEVILQLAKYGGHEAGTPAHYEAMKMAESLNRLEQEMQSMNSHPIFKWMIRIWRHVLK